MKTFKKISILAVAIALMCVAALLGSCGEETPAETTYKVTVKNALGDPYTSGVIVQFHQNGSQIAMQACNENGVAEKVLATGEYDVKLSFTDTEKAYYYSEDLKVSAENAEIEVIMANKLTAEPSVIYTQDGEFDVYALSEGCTYVQVTSEHRNYFTYAPAQAGNYEISIVDGANATIGYYGAPHFVQSMSVAEVKDNKFTVSVSASMIGTGDSGTSTYVIGIDALDESVKNCVIGIKRIGDPIKTIEDEPWIIYETTADLVEYSLPADAEIAEFDLTASTDTYNLVYNENDGFYHLDSADGPLVLVRLAEDCDYIACFQTILDRSGVSKYFFDEDGNFEKKISYSECLLEYIACVDEVEGVYPLTEDLKHIIIERGDYVGWWNPESSSYLFKDVDGNNLTDINNDIAWLLMCCYIK